MAFVSTGLNLMVDVFGGAMPRIWTYTSTDTSAVVASTAYFAGAGLGSPRGSPLGLKVGDFVMVQESTSGATPGRTTMHTAVSSTANASFNTSSTAGYDISVSSTAA